MARRVLLPRPGPTSRAQLGSVTKLVARIPNYRPVVDGWKLLWREWPSTPCKSPHGAGQYHGKILLCTHRLPRTRNAIVLARMVQGWRSLSGTKLGHLGTSPVIRSSPFTVTHSFRFTSVAYITHSFFHSRCRFSYAPWFDISLGRSTQTMAPRYALVSLLLSLSIALRNAVDAQANNETGPIAAPYLSVCHSAASPIRGARADRVCRDQT